VILGKEVNLRHSKPEDIGLLARFMNDVELKGKFARTNLKSPVNLRKEFEENGLSSEVNETFIITDKEDNLVGTIGHMQTVPYSTAREIGFSVFELKNRGKGYATEAVSLLTSYLFDTRPINRVQICMPLGHEACEKLVKKCGFTQEGVVRGSIFVRGQYLDTYMYSMLRSEIEENT